jgi:hypothetical protein
MIILVRGMCFVDELGVESKGPEGRQWVESSEHMLQWMKSGRLRAIMQQLPEQVSEAGYPVPQPDLLFCDKANWCWRPQKGTGWSDIQPEWQEAIASQNFSMLHGQRTKQAGVAADLLPHETLVAQLKRRMRICAVMDENLNSVERHRASLRAAVQFANNNYDLMSLCGQLHDRCKLCVEKGGQRIKY